MAQTISYYSLKCSETELTNALARIYYAVDNSEPNVSNNQDIVPKHEVTKSDKVGDTIIPNKIAGTNNVSENNRSRSSQKGSKHLESDEILHKRKRITYDEDDYPSYSNGQQRGGQRCSLCKGYNHDERTCEEIRSPDNDEVSNLLFLLYKYMCIFILLQSTWRLYNKQEAKEPTRNIRSYCYNCAGNHFGQVRLVEFNILLNNLAY